MGAPEWVPQTKGPAQFFDTFPTAFAHNFRFARYTGGTGVGIWLMPMARCFVTLSRVAQEELQFSSNKLVPLNIKTVISSSARGYRTPPAILAVCLVEFIPALLLLMTLA